MNSSLLQVLTIVAGFVMAAPVLAATAPARVATVNGVAIPKAYVDVIVKAQTQQGSPDSEELRASITDRLIEMEVLAQEARKKGLGKTRAASATRDPAFAGARQCLRAGLCKESSDERRHGEGRV